MNLELIKEAGVIIVKLDGLEELEKVSETVGIEAWIIFDVKDNRVREIEIVPKSREEFNLVLEKLKTLANVKVVD